MDVLQLIRDAFPVRSPRVTLEQHEVVVRDDGALIVTVRLVTWDIADGAESIRDVKEQGVWLGDAAELAQPRTEAVVAGWRLALAHLLARDDIDWLEDLMPADLMPPFVDLLALKRPRDAEDFAEALLASKQRLGRWLES